MAPRTVILPPPPGSSSVHVDDNNTEEAAGRARKIFNLVWQMADLCSQKKPARRVFCSRSRESEENVNRPAPWPHCSPSTPPSPYRIFCPAVSRQNYTEIRVFYVQREIDARFELRILFYDSFVLSFFLFPEGSERRDYNL